MTNAQDMHTDLPLLSKHSSKLSTTMWVILASKSLAWDQVVHSKERDSPSPVKHSCLYSFIYKDMLADW